MLAAALLVLLAAGPPQAEPAPAAPSPGRLLVLAKSAASAVLIDLARGEVAATLPTGIAPHEVAIHPGGRWAVVTNYGAAEAGSTLSVLDLTEPARAPRLVELREPVRPHGLVFEPDGRHLWVTAEAAAQVWRVDFASGEVVRRVATGLRTGHMIARAPDGRLYVSDLGAGRFLPIEADGTPGEAVASGAGAEGIAVSPDGARLWVTNREADTVRVWDTAGLKPLRELPCAGFPIRVALAPDGRLALVSCARAGEVAIFDARELAPRGRIRLEREALGEAEERLFGERFGASPVPIGIAIAADSRRAWVACAGADVVAELDLELDPPRVVRFLPAGKEPDGIVWLP